MSGGSAHAEHRFADPSIRSPRGSAHPLDPARPSAACRRRIDGGVADLAARRCALSRRLLVLAGLAALGQGVPASAGPAGAGAAGGRPADVPPGVIIYVREVPTRQAQLPGQPGTPHFVDVGPDELVIGTLAAALHPLSDVEQGAIGAPAGLSNADRACGAPCVDLSASVASAAALGIDRAPSAGNGGGASSMAPLGSALSQSLAALRAAIPGPR